MKGAKSVLTTCQPFREKAIKAAGADDGVDFDLGYREIKKKLARLGSGFRT